MEKQVARFEQMRNDLFWEAHCPKCWQNGRQFTLLKWWGYNDRNWWDNVAPKAATRKCPKCSSSIQIDFRTREIILGEDEHGKE